MYCAKHGKYDCTEQHGAWGGRVCEQCGEDRVFADGLCRLCLLSDGESKRRQPEKCSKCRLNYQYAEGKCYICYTYRKG